MSATSTCAPALEALRVNVIVRRAKARLSQEELAERAGVSRPTISRIERASGDVGIDVVQRIADALTVSVAELFTITPMEVVDENTIIARSVSSDEDFVDAEALLDALDEAAGEIERYSRAGRPPVAR